MSKTKAKSTPLTFGAIFAAERRALADEVEAQP